MSTIITLNDRRRPGDYLAVDESLAYPGELAFASEGYCGRYAEITLTPAQARALVGSLVEWLRSNGEAVK